MSFTFKFFIMLAVVAGGAYLLSREESTVGVNIHGVNHTAETFSFYLADPANLEGVSGGSGLISPFGASGISCCAVLPRVWEPGSKLHIHATHWLKKLPDGTLPEIKEIVETEIPKYSDGVPAELWVLRKPDGKIEVVLSNYQPDHPEWPGKIKGWPIPSIEYRRQRWEIYRKYEADGVVLYKSLLEELEKDPESRAKDAWESYKKYRPELLHGFSGPDDPLYRAELKNQYILGLERSKQSLQKIMEVKP